MKNVLRFPPVRLLALFFCVAGSWADAADLNIAAPADVAPKIHRTAPLHFPLRMLRDGVKRGEARILLHVDNEGTLGDALVVGYTHASFAEEVQRAVKEWHFEPARSKGEAVSAVVDLNVVFEVDGVVVVERMSTPVNNDPVLHGDDVYQPRGLKNLDKIPVPSHIVPPVYPPEWREKGLAERITVDFYIDETGQVRMPTVVAGKNLLLRASALAAVEQWRFEPPTYKGKPVLAHVQQVFDFSTPATP